MSSPRLARIGVAAGALTLTALSAGAAMASTPDSVIAQQAVHVTAAASTTMAPATYSGTCTINTSGVRIRSGAGLSYSVRGLAYRGQAFAVYGHSDAAGTPGGWDYGVDKAGGE